MTCLSQKSDIDCSHESFLSILCTASGMGFLLICVLSTISENIYVP